MSSYTTRPSRAVALRVLPRVTRSASTPKRARRAPRLSTSSSSNQPERPPPWQGPSYSEGHHDAQRTSSGTAGENRGGTRSRHFGCQVSGGREDHRQDDALAARHQIDCKKPLVLSLQLCRLQDELPIEGLRRWRVRHEPNHHGDDQEPQSCQDG